jgi:hypothetical protein
MLKTSHSKHCLIQGVTFKDSPNHNLVMYCDYMEADHVTLFTALDLNFSGGLVVVTQSHTGA